jgi:hypothetical protein
MKRAKGNGRNVMRGLAFPERFSREEASVMAEAIEGKCAGGVPGATRKKGLRIDPDIYQKCGSE